MKNIIRFSTEDYKVMKKHLASAGKDESFIYGIFSKAKGEECIIYICSRLIIPDKNQLENQSSVSIVPSRKYQSIAYGMGYELGMSVIDIHTHPFTTNAKFSGTDNYHGTKNAMYITENFPESSTMGMIVFGKGFDNFEAHIWNKENKCFEPVNRIEVLGTPTTILINSNAKPVKTEDNSYARHKIIPGWKQGLLEDLKVFVCGLGGNGALIFDSLLSLGIGKNNGWIKACDPDVLEESNLPRIPYAYPLEVGKPKAEIAQVHAKYKAPDNDTHCYQAGIEDANIQQFLKEANIIFGAVDNDGARIILNSLAARYTIPYIDLGTEIIPENSSYEAIGQVHAFIPGKTACLICTGAINPSEAALDSMSKKGNAEYERAGYIRGTNETPTPSVLHLNGVISHLAISQLLKMIFNDCFNGNDYLHYNRQKSTLFGASSIRDDLCPVCGLQGYVGDGDETEEIADVLSEFKKNNQQQENKEETPDNTLTISKQEK
jgi:molybdopterin/thiamine biosynthesis adenylyltransferase